MSNAPSNLIGIFPLQLVAYPGEKVNLHIFEPRYKQLITECRDLDKSFIIPPYIQDEVMPFGTEMRLLEVAKEYNDGKLDISVEGIRPVRIIEIFSQYPGRLYGGAEVLFLETDETPDIALTDKIVRHVKELYALLNIKRPIPAVDTSLKSYDIAHHIGLNIEQEFKLLTLPHESDRQRYIIDHLETFLPLTRQMIEMQQRAKQNGEFRNFDPLDWE